ncbi:hypothetical protein WJX72_005289 [[Myrmecia] bisecta]|uniref:Patatin n=1 Tax=[Myrmecia] bisecta TaxID=41462 RepID=A0AAW1QF15_9CHLO
MSVFGRRILGGQPDAFRLVLGYQVGSIEASNGQPLVEDDASQEVQPGTDETTASHYQTAMVDWTADEADAAVVSKLKSATVEPILLEERVQLKLTTTDGPGGVMRASAPLNDVEVTLKVQKLVPKLRRLDLARVSTSGSVSPALMASLMQACKLEGVTRLTCAEGFVSIWEHHIISRLTSLQTLNLGYCGLVTLPGAIGKLTALKDLRVHSNKLTALPHELGLLTSLQRLVADTNLLTSIPVELRFCSQLREVSLEANKITTPVVDLRSLSHLRSLQLHGNPLEFLPELQPCKALRHLSLANVRMSADVSYTTWEVEVVAASYVSRASKLSALFALIFRRSSAQHPLLAGALGRIAEDPLNCEAISREVGAIQQLILMALSEDEVVVEQACKAIGLLGRHNSLTSAEIVQSDVLSAMLSLITSPKIKSQLAGFQVVASLALTSDAAAKKLCSLQLQASLMELIRSGADDVKAAALETLGNLAFCLANRAIFLMTPGLRPLLSRLAQSHPGEFKQRVRITATRALAILGENEEVRRAVAQPPIRGRGIRILAMDGGGMKGIATLRLLRQLEERSGRAIHEMFDLICGTSTGGILAVALAIKRFSLAECEEIYRTLGQKVFSQPNPKAQEADSWRDSLYRAYKTGQQSMRVAVYGCKHDAAMFEELLKQFCRFGEEGCIGDTMIDTACLQVPKCFVVSTLASMTPAGPFIFRNFEHPPSSAQLARQIRGGMGSSRHLVWQAVRASSAAPYYLDDFVCGSDRFQDGAATANNPAGLALREARLLWPDAPIDCLVSLGSGSVPVRPREKSMSAYLDTGSVLIESACSVERVDMLLSTLLPLVPNLKYFRFNCEDARCGIELDSIDPAQWALIEAATDDYIERVDAQFDAVAAVLCEDITVERPLDIAHESLGMRRGMIVIEGPRTTDQASCSHVEEVGRLVARLPQCLHTASLASSSADADPAQVIAKCVQDNAAHVGVLHLALHGNEAGLVVRWRQQLQAVTDPGASARAMLIDAGQDPATTPFADFALHQRGYQRGDTFTSFLSSQTHLVGRHMRSAYLFQRVSPEALLAAEQVAQQMDVWQRLTVICTSVMGLSLVHAFLSGGAKAVVCRDKQAAGPDAVKARRFFQRFYAELFAGRAILRALAFAGEEVPELRHAYCCCYLQAGQVLVAEQTSMEPPPTDDPDALADV